MQRLLRGVGGPARRLSLDDKFKLCRSIAEECTTEDELRKKLEHVPHPVAYDGFEPSGRMHIAQVPAPVRHTGPAGGTRAIRLDLAAEYFTSH